MNLNLFKLKKFNLIFINKVITKILIFFIFRKILFFIIKGYPNIYIYILAKRNFVNNNENNSFNLKNII